ncbi:MAG: hypothetical protein H6Q60_1323 [Oscillospiraceae bacterium]|nr:hypothetical protein [Oscillospiraceae bacterium]
MSKEPENQSKFKTTCGGQALIEGVMMQGPTKRAAVVRKPDGGLAVTESESQRKSGLWKVPFLRGVGVFGSSMKNGVKALMWSAEYYPEEENAQPSKFDLWLEKHFSDEKLTSIIVTIGMVVGIGFSVGLFFILPTLLTGLITPYVQSNFLRNLIEGFIRIGLFLGYLIAISNMKDMKRVFSYHGAEHKTIFCYEAGLELTVENVRKQPKHHPRCGTSFLFVIMIVSILVFALLGFSWSSPWIRLATRLLMLPVLVAISYEINRFVGRYDNLLCRLVRAPGMWLQNFTTREPDDSMLEVSIEALNRVLPEKEGADRW